MKPRLRLIEPVRETAGHAAAADDDGDDQGPQYSIACVF